MGDPVAGGVILGNAAQGDDDLLLCARLKEKALFLDCDGGKLYLSDAQGNLVTSLEYPEAVSRCSWARTRDGGDTWNYCANPSPGKTNAGCNFLKDLI